MVMPVGLLIGFESIFIYICSLIISNGVEASQSAIRDRITPGKSETWGRKKKKKKRGKKKASKKKISQSGK